MYGNREGLLNMSVTETPGTVAPTILLVDDNELVVEVTRTMLEENGYRVVSAFLPYVALNLAAQKDFPVDLLVTDVVMPQINGPELYRRMKERRPGLPVLYMSGYSDMAIQGVMGGEQAHFLAKPFDSCSLLEQVAHILNA